MRFFIFWVINDFVHNFQLFSTNQKNVFAYFIRCAMFWIGFIYSWVVFLRFLVFETWSILYFTFVFHSGHFVFYILYFQHPTGLRPVEGWFPVGPRMVLDWGSKPHWLTSESDLQKSLPDFLLLTIVEYKINHITKTKNCTKKNPWIKKSDSEHCASKKIWSVKNTYEI